LDRIQGSIEIKENKESFEFPIQQEPKKLSANNTEGTATIDIRKGKAHSLRVFALSTKDLGEWDQITVPINGIEALVTQILWHGEDVLVQEPTILREFVIAQLEALVNAHG
jgi:proteasome accessory factor B